MIHPPLQVVDENDNPTGVASRDEIVEEGLYHRISRIMLTNPEGKILLQKRSMHVFFPGLWDHSAAGHVDGGEDYITAAKREMLEEIGVEGIELEEAAYYKTEEMLEGYNMKRFNKLYRGKIDSTPSNLNKEEVDHVTWFTLAEIKEMIKSQPDELTVGLKYVIDRFY